MRKELKEGDKIIPFKLTSDSDEVVSTKEMLGEPVVLYFYPKDDTPGCTKEACSFQENLTKFNKLDVRVFGISKDSVEKHQKFKKKYGLKFPLLSDDKGEVCEKYGVWVEKALYGRKYMGIERATFVFNEKGVLIKAFRKVKVDGHVEEVLKILK